MPSEFETIFEKLRDILKRNTGKLTVKHDGSGSFWLQGGVHPKHKTPIPVAGVEIGKAYVSYHLMAVYAFPKLMEGHSAELKARQQGKSCFNFKKVDEALFKELEQLTVESFAAWKKTGFGP